MVFHASVHRLIAESEQGCPTQFSVKQPLLLRFWSHQSSLGFYAWWEGDGHLDWHWDGHKMTALIHGRKPVKVRLGGGFPMNAPLQLAYHEE